MKNIFQRERVHHLAKKSFSVLFICLAILIPLLIQSNPTSAAIRAVVIEDEAAPGFDNGSIFYDLAGGMISINNSGQTTFTANIKSGSTYYKTLWRENSGTLSLINRSGENPPGTTGDVLFSDFVNPNINDSGIVAFVANVQGNDVITVYPTNNVGVWKGTPGSVTLVARAGDTAPGASGDTFGERFSAIVGDTVAFNNDGRVAFYNNLINKESAYASVASNSVWQETAAGLTMIAKTGEAVPGFADATYGHFKAGIPLNNNGDLAFFPHITGTFDWTHLTGMYLVQKAVNGSITTEYTGYLSAAAGVAGKTFSDFPTGSQNYDMNASGHLVFHASLEPGGTNRNGVWSDASGSLALVARQGSQAPGTPAGAVFDGFGNPVMDDAGQVAFGANLERDAGGVDNTNGSGIWYETGRVLKLIARAGDRAPGTPDGVVFNTQFNYYSINNAGQVFFQTWLAGPGIDDTNSAGIWLYDPSAGLSLVVREGDEVTLTSGETVTFNDITISSGGGTHTPCSGGSDGRVRYFNNTGEIAFKANVSPGYREGFFIANTSGSAPATEICGDDIDQDCDGIDKQGIVSDIKANGSDGPINITSTDNLSIEIQIAPGDFSGDNADWWLVAATPFGLFHYLPADGSWVSGLTFSHQGPLFNLGEFEVLNISGLPAGSYTLYFGVDMDMNGLLDMDKIYYDSVTVNIQ